MGTVPRNSTAPGQRDKTQRAVKQLVKRLNSCGQHIVNHCFSDETLNNDPFIFKFSSTTEENNF
jgi:hypothetical protein